MVEVFALVSVGRHPVSGRERRGAGDARAVELALRLVGQRLRIVHAGDPERGALRDYLGMGVVEITVLRTAAGDDVVPALADHIGDQRGEVLVVTGTTAESGEGSGLVPYLVARRLGWPVIAGAVEFELVGQDVRVVQGLPRGQRRIVEASLPAVIAVGPGAPAPRASAYGPARRGHIRIIDVDAPPDARSMLWLEVPARRRPKRFRGVRGGSAAERMLAATAVISAGGEVLQLSPDEAARAILDYLRNAGAVRS